MPYPGVSTDCIGVPSPPGINPGIQLSGDPLNPKGVPCGDGRSSCFGHGRGGKDTGILSFGRAEG
jgi:hypothetical protein